MLKRAIILVLALLTATALAQSQQKPPRQQARQAPSNQTAQPPTTDQRGTDKEPFTVKILPAETPKDETDKAEREKFEKATADRKLAFETQRVADYTLGLVSVTCLLFFIAVVQAGLFLWQLWLIRESLGHARAATNAANASAIAARDSVVTMQKNALTELRAYVGVSYTEVKIDYAKNQLLAFVDYQNAGQTTAHDVVLRMSAKVDFLSPAPDWTTPNTVQDEGKGGMLLPTVIWRRHCPVVEGAGDSLSSLIKELGVGKKVIWVWGIITYKDIFKRDCEVQFRFWSSNIKRKDPTNQHWCFALIPESENTKATYGDR
jgi:hypothetical protein